MVVKNENHGKIGIMSTKIVILSDNRACSALVGAEHGLAVYMECAAGRFLFDTGASAQFISNARALGVDLAEVDYCLISHGHSDHIGGLQAFLDINSKAKVILSAQIPGAEYVSVRRIRHSITSHIDFEKYGARMVFIEENATVGNIHIFANIACRHPLPLGDKNLLIRDATQQFVPDDFRHELAFLVDGVLFTGCAHSGILNILESVQQPPAVSIGGFHLLDSGADQNFESDEQLERLAHHLAAGYPQTVFYTGHCTGDRCFRILSAANPRIRQFHCGDVIELDEA